MHYTLPFLKLLIYFLNVQSKTFLLDDVSVVRIFGRKNSHFRGKYGLFLKHESLGVLTFAVGLGFALSPKVNDIEALAQSEQSELSRLD